MRDQETAFLPHGFTVVISSEFYLADRKTYPKIKPHPVPDVSQNDIPTVPPPRSSYT